MKRIKLFSDSRIKLFSQNLHRVKCGDCGNIMETAANVSQVFCSKCGGKRLYVIGKDINVDDDDSNELKESELTEKLKKYSGKTVEKSIFEKNFSEYEDLIEKGYASVEGDSYQISPLAYETEKMFSKLTITVTKEIDLDPTITTGACPIEEAIQGIKGPEKGIIMIRKAHCILPPKEEPKTNWLEDSHIVGDLRTEFGGEKKGIKQFMDIISNRYPDAPDDIIDDLVSRGAIKINGNQITVNR